MITFSPQMLGDFQSGELSIEELKEMIKEVIAENHGGQVTDIRINDDGLVNVILSDGDEIEIEIDWNEIILR